MCTICGASDYHNMPRWVVVLCMYRRYMNMLAAQKASISSQQEKQALHKRSAEIEALESWAKPHDEQEWHQLSAECKSEWRERQPHDPRSHGPHNFGREILSMLP